MPASSMPAPFDLEQWLAENPEPLSIVQTGHPVLRQPAAPVPQELFGTPVLAQLIERMVTAMRLAPGVGLAGPQIGVPLRVFVAEDPEERLKNLPKEVLAERGRTPLPLTVLINPTVEGTSKDVTATFFEGCLSVRGYAALVARWKTVSVRGVDVAGKALAFEWAGWPARIAQHEMDHLEGTLYVDRMLSRSLTAETEYARWSGSSVADVLRELVER